MAGRFERLWYENDDGEHIPCSPSSLEAPKGATIQVSRFPHELRTTYLRLNKDGSSSRVAVATATYSADLVLAICRPSLKNRAIQLLRFRSLAETHDHEMAIFMAAESCERCINSLAHRYGLDWGYREFSDDWHRSGTVCARCEHHGRGRFWSQDSEGRWSKKSKERIIDPSPPLKKALERKRSMN